VNRSICLIFLCAALPLAGCDSSRAPSFTLSEQSQELSGFAQEKVQGELEAGFGTPSSLVVWSELDVDFGQYSGKVARVGPKAGMLRIGEPASDEAADSEESAYDGLIAVSDLASASRLSELRGAAVVVSHAQPEPSADEEAAAGAETAAEPTDGEAEAAPAKAPEVYRVASYDKVSQNLTVVDVDGAPAQLNVAEGDTVQIFGSELQRGRNLYLRHCMHCHGVSGDGAGPTAQYFRVKPRDYRRGIIKFTSTKTTVPKPSRDDLFRIVKLGVPGTYMPSFMLLPDDEVKSIAEYVRWLAMRGEMERKLNAWLNLDYSKTSVADAEATAAEIQAEFDTAWAEDSSDNIQRYGGDLKMDWEDADKAESVDNPTTPRTPTSPESIKRGREIFVGKTAKCATCHGETGRGNGPSTEGFNDLPGQPGVKSDKAGLFDDWGNIVKPRNLTTGVFRGGRRPIDIYRRIHTGIKGTPMPGAGKSLTDEQIWDVVNYVLSIPFKESSTAH
jgi:mono/diheme cytochrome c family protein